MKEILLILMGSDSDAPIMQAAVDVLREFQIPCEMTVRRRIARLNGSCGSCPRRPAVA